jgi:HEAT repeat protein/nucleoside phosphorylase/MinD-like ATPase involved in chromosome partitioning or flagellar assembly
MKPQKSKIITFYSYKGGVGRSMALANVAWLLSSKEEKRVLIVDWDIEAPGIHRYFDIPDEKIERGLVDLFYDYKSLLMEEDPDVENGIINVDNYIINIPTKSKNDILLLPAGRVDRKYPNKVNDFDWNDFYENWQGFGFIEYLKEQLKKKADFILVDSRTGLSDISGICTMQIPDIVVLLFTSNEQNLYGTKFVCESISTKSIQLPGRNEPPKLILIPSRIESYLEKVLVAEWEIHATEILKEYLPKNENFLYIRNMSIPYIAYYSFGEKIAVNNDPHDDISKSIEKLTKMINDVCSLLDISSKIKARILDAITTQDPRLRNKLLLEVVSELKEEETSSDSAKLILKIILDEVKSSSDDELIAKTLKEISFDVHLVDTSEFLTALKRIQNENKRASVLALVIKELVGSNGIDILNIIKNIENENLKTDLLIELIKEGTNYTNKDSIIEEVLDLSAEIQDENSKIKLFIELLSSQSISVRIMLIKEILSKLSTFKDQDLVFTYLRQMVSYIKSLVEKDLVTDSLKIWLQKEDPYIRKNVVFILGEINSEKAIQIIIDALKDSNYSVRMSAAEKLKTSFLYVSDKEQVWNNLIKLTSDKDNYVRGMAAEALGSTFQYVPDKEQAWNNLIKLTSDNDNYVRRMAVEALGRTFQYVPDKEQAWNNLIKLTSDNDNYVRRMAVESLRINFQNAPDKKQMWSNLIKLTSDNDKYVRGMATEALGSTFQYVPNKQQTWNDLIKLTHDKDHDVGYRALETLGSAFSYVPDKKLAWNDLIKLTHDKDHDVRYRALETLGSAFSYVPDKQQVWDDLIKLTSDKDNDERSKVAEFLSSVFSYVPYKQQAWNDLIKLTNCENSYVRSRVAEFLGSAFFYVPDKRQAWNDLHLLTDDKDSDMRFEAASALGFAFLHLPDKQQAWNDLIKLTNDESSDVRYKAASALGFAFPHLPDKQQAWNDLIKLTNDESNYVRTFANHSLGKASIFQASQAEKEEDYKKELEKAIAFFETAAQESPSKQFNPSRFCLPFYRSFHTIIFEKQQAKEEVNKYRAEAKDSVRSSKKNKLIFEAVENLAKALKELQNLESLNLEAKRDELKLYQKYCDRAEELMNCANKKAPATTEVLRNGLPLLDRTLKGLLEEIKNKAKTICRESKGTNNEELACAVNEEVQKWEIGSQEEMRLYIENFTFTLESKIPRVTDNTHIFEMIDEIKNQKNTIKLYKNALELIEIIPRIIIVPERMKPTIGVITVLPKEYVAVNVLLENKKDIFIVPDSGAGRRYCLGEIPTEEGNKHNIVLANAGMGNNTATIRASLLLNHFPNVKSILMVGIAGGIPNPDKINDNIRLGDIVVSYEQGIIQYDYVENKLEKVEYRNPPRPPSASLVEAVRYLEAKEILGNRSWEKYIDQALSQLKIERPSEDKDILYFDSRKRKIKHLEDSKRIKGQPRIFIGPIASANILLKNPKAIDELRDKFKVKAIEMEASGIADATWNHEVGYLVVRGICDYSDSHKNDEWQQYAAVVAAAYTRALIESMP